MTDSKDNEQDPNQDQTSATPETETPEPTPESEPHDSYTAPEPEPEVYAGGIWLRALHMIIFAFLFGVAEALLAVMALFQFLWMLFTKKRNPSIAQFGDQVSQWLRDVGRFQTGATDDKPFPWSDSK